MGNQGYQHYFLGANTPDGFVSRFDQLTDPEQFEHVYVLKGTPGNGKSTLLRRIASAFEGKCGKIELIHCSFDPDSLDAVVLGDWRTVVVDGTPPHPVEPQYAEAVELLVPLNAAVSGMTAPEKRSEVIALTEQKRRLCRQAGRYLAAAGTLLSDIDRLALEATDREKVARLAERIAEKEFGRPLPQRGREQIRLLSGIRENSVLLFSETACQLAERIYLLEDAFGPSSRLLLEHLRSLALKSGHDIVSCVCPMSGARQTEHLFLPALSLGFMTQNHFLSPQIPPYKVVNSRRFTDRNALKNKKARISFNKKAANQMFQQAAGLFSEAREVQKKLEALYRPAIDFQAVDAITERLIQTIAAEHGV